MGEGRGQVEREHRGLAVAVGSDLQRHSKASVADSGRRESVRSGGRRPELQHIDSITTVEHEREANKWQE